MKMANSAVRDTIDLEFKQLNAEIMNICKAYEDGKETIEVEVPIHRRDEFRKLLDKQFGMKNTVFVREKLTMYIDVGKFEYTGKKK